MLNGITTKDRFVAFDPVTGEIQGYYDESSPNLPENVVRITNEIFSKLLTYESKYHLNPVKANSGKYTKKRHTDFDDLIISTEHDKPKPKSQPFKGKNIDNMSNTEMKQLIKTMAEMLGIEF